eukprot:364726-Chlamydomonas_euryale.AAC.5
MDSTICRMPHTGWLDMGSTICRMPQSARLTKHAACHKGGSNGCMPHAAEHLQRAARVTRAKAACHMLPRARLLACLHAAVHAAAVASSRPAGAPHLELPCEIFPEAHADLLLRHRVRTFRVQQQAVHVEEAGSDGATLHAALLCHLTSLETDSGGKGQRDRPGPMQTRPCAVAPSFLTRMHIAARAGGGHVQKDSERATRGRCGPR